MKLLPLLFGLLLLGRQAAAQISSPHCSYAGHDFSYFSVRITADEAARFSIVENPGLLRHPDFVASQQTGNPFLLLNASITDNACQPLGYYVLNSSELKPANTQTGDGNFFLKPNGAFLVTATGVSVVETSAIAAQTGVVFGIQSGPLLLQNGTVNPAFNPSSANRHLRCGVGTSTVGGEQLVNFAISNDEVTFFELASFLQDRLKCTAALCLESQGCAMYFPERDAPAAADSATICRYIKYTVE